MKHVFALALLILGSAAVFAGDDTQPVGPEIPEALLPWKLPDFPSRIFVQVAAPGEAGDINLLPDISTASIQLPSAQLFPPPLTATAACLQLIGEDGAAHWVGIHPIPNSTDVEITFRTQPRQRRFCLYYGARAAGATGERGSRGDSFLARVRLKGKEAPPEFDRPPYSRENFEKLLEGPEGRRQRGMGALDVPTINQVECPFFNISVNGFGHVQDTFNPQHYTAVYEALLRAPVSGEYKFSLDTPGAGCVVIDGNTVVSIPQPDPQRAPFAVQNSVSLYEGVHRVVVYYAEASGGAKTNLDQSLFGLRLHWQPPFAKALMCIPAQSFCRLLPAIAVRSETKQGAQPFIDVEGLGHIRVGAHLGDGLAREMMLVSARMTDFPAGSALKITSPALKDARMPADVRQVFTYVPIGSDVTLEVVDAAGKASFNRVVRFPYAARMSKEVLELEGELLLKSAPEFLYSDEACHIHLETILSPRPIILPKERVQAGYLPPLPRPMGQFTLSWTIDPKLDGSEDATPTVGTRCKRLRSFEPAVIEPLARDGKSLTLSLAVGGAHIEDISVRLLHSRSKVWPGEVKSEPGCLYLARKETESKPAGAPANPADRVPGRNEIAGERVVMIVPHEDEAEYRRFSALKALVTEDTGGDALFVGDPLIEKLDDETKMFGVDKRIAKAMPQKKWQFVSVAGPHRYQPIFSMLSALENHIAALPNRKAPGTAVICLGSGDVARQTPLHAFERALDVMIDRLRIAGTTKIIVVGVLPEPWREKQCAPYQDRVLDILRQHHLDGVDIFQAWTKESDWARRYSLDDDAQAPVSGPVPNSASLDEIVEKIKGKL